MRMIFLFFFLCYCLTARCQQDNRVEYVGGVKELNKLLGKGFPDNLIGDPSLGTAWTEKYYIIGLRIKPDGSLNDNITILSIKDTVLTRYILDFAHKTAGHWANHTDKEQLVILPLYYFYDDGFNPLPQAPLIRLDAFVGNRRDDPVYFDPIITRVLPLKR